MKLVIFGLTISSSWGNGHATLWRGLCRAMVKRGHQVVFFEKDVPYYANHRDLVEIPGMDLILYSDWNEIEAAAKKQLSDADAGMVTSYCPDGVVASQLVLSSGARLKTFYDLDTPVTLDCLKSGRKVDYIPANGFGDFDLVLSYTGGVALEELKTRLGARRVAPLYGSVDPETHYPLAPVQVYQADLSYIGTYAEDRQGTLTRLFIDAARLLRQQRFIIAGAMYPQEFPWTENIYFVRHLPPQEHPAFYCSSRITLNVTRRAMAEMGYCPSGRLFEAAACGTPLLSDWWEGLDQFFEPGSEIIVAQRTDDTLNALDLSAEQLSKIALAARERVLGEHTADHRVKDLEAALQFASSSVTDTELMEA
jgi:spore maturation protein CgeB